MAQLFRPVFPVFHYSDFDLDALCHIANEIRRGPRCFCNLNQIPARGGFNWAILIQFEDGVEWVFRSPVQNHPELSNECVTKLLSSEAATLKFLKHYTTIPVPYVFSHWWVNKAMASEILYSELILGSPNKENPIRIPYILMSKANGKTLEMMCGIENFHRRLDSLDIPIKRVMFQLGQITWKLCQLRFAQIGSLFEEDGHYIIGECLSRGHLQHKRHSLKRVRRGPFDTDREFYNSLIAAFTRQAEVLPLGHHCFAAPVPSKTDFSTIDEWKDACSLWGEFVTVGQKVDTAVNRADYVVAGNALNEMITRYESNWQNITSSTPFALYHPDLSMNNIFVDDHYNITCIIDWAFATTVPLPWLLSPPGFPQSRNRLEDRFCLGFRDGFKHASSLGMPAQFEGFSIPKAMQCIENNQFAWCLSRLLALDSTDDLSLFRTLWESVYPPERTLESFFFWQRTLLNFRRRYAAIRLEDLSAGQIRKTENDAFTKAQQFELSLARHLTMVSDWGVNYDQFKCAGLREVDQIFITEPRLWRWILKFKEEYRERVGIDESQTGTEENLTGAEETLTGAEETQTGTEEHHTDTEEHRTGTEEHQTGIEENQTGTEENLTGAEENLTITEESKT